MTGEIMTCHGNKVFKDKYSKEMDQKLFCSIDSTAVVDSLRYAFSSSSLIHEIEKLTYEKLR